MMRKRVAGLLVILSMLLSACGHSAAAWQEQYDLGVRYLSEGNYEEAILAFSAAIEIDPKAVDGYWGRAEAYAKSGNEPSAWGDVKKIVDLTEDVTQIQDKLDELGAMFENSDVFDSLIHKYVEDNKPNPGPAPEQTETEKETAEDAVLEELLEEYAESAVTHDRFLSCTGIDVVPYPANTKGTISGYMLDLDADGIEELITAWSDGNGIYLKLSDRGDDHALQEFDSEMILTLDYSKNIQVALYYRPLTDQWLVAAAEFTYGSYTGYHGFLCELYQVRPDGFALLDTWEQNNMLGIIPENLIGDLEEVQWPIRDGHFIYDLNSGEIESLTYLVKLDAVIDPGTDGFSHMDDLYYQQFLSQDELEELAQAGPGGSRTEPESLSAYRPILEQALRERGEEHHPGSGFFFDLDGDGTQEMVIEQTYIEDGTFPYSGYSVYTIENGTAVNKVYRGMLAPAAGGPDWRVAAASYDGKSVLEIMVDNGETGGGGVRRETETTLYDGKTLEPVVTFTKAYQDGAEDYSDSRERPYAWTLNGAECTEAEYHHMESGIERYITTNTWDANDPLKGMPLREMLNYVNNAG